ncbi:MAG: HupE/UreJ family protein [Alphaproteobacteria bacterium]|nr:HupE/UreJ family protein [Alphaproteobacteria bacterium]
MRRSLRYSPRSVLALALLCLAAWAALAPSGARAHNLSYAVAKVAFAEDASFAIELHFFVPAFILGQPQAHLTPETMERWAATPEAELEAAVERARAYLREGVEVYADGQRFALDEVAFPDIATLREDGLVPPEDARPSAPVLLYGKLPAGARTFSVVMPLDFTQTVVNIQDAFGTSVTQPLAQGQRSHPFVIERGRASRDLVIPITIPSVVVTFFDFGRFGFDHIIPDGIDHILFILGLFLFLPQWGPLAIQVTAFTVAHSVTLALSVFGLIDLPKLVIEPLIAASIAAVAFDNMFASKLHRWRTAVVFAFGLLHGIGFAEGLRALGLPSGEEAVALISFNLGVEAGQLFVLAVAFIALGWYQQKPWYRARVVIPASLLIGGIGVFWTVERLVANL